MFRSDADRTWRTAVVAALLLQALFLVGFAWKARGGWLYADNVFYESPAWNLASGSGFTMATGEFNDPDLTAIYRRAHPESAGSQYVPSATFPSLLSMIASGTPASLASMRARMLLR